MKRQVEKIPKSIRNMKYKKKKKDKIVSAYGHQSFMFPLLFLRFTKKNSMKIKTPWRTDLINFISQTTNIRLWDYDVDLLVFLVGDFGGLIGFSIQEK